MSLGETVSDISGNIIDTTIQKSKELEKQKEVLRNKEAGYNRIREEIAKGDNDVLRRDDTKRISETERVLRNGEYGRDSRQNQGEYTEQFGGTDGIHQGISESYPRSHSNPNPLRRVFLCRCSFLDLRRKAAIVHMVTIELHLSDSRRRISSFSMAIIFVL